MEAVVQFLAALFASLFAGAALYGSLVEGRATLALTREDPVAHFVRGFPLAAAFQAPLVFLGTAAGTTAAVLTGEGLWIAGAALMASIIVITAVAILPLNAKLLRSEERAATCDRRDLVIRWYRLHAVRAFLALAASALFVVALVRAG
jgi:Domain of unknown function (DUF1772)